MTPPPFEKSATACHGLFLLKPRIFADQRGAFVKTFHENLFQALDIPFTPREEFFSVSGKNVLRGMHFQVPPAAHAKLVYCATGKILDVVVDIRKSSPTYGQAVSRELSETNREIFFIPPGFAHGFLSLTEDSLVIYKTDFVHAPAQDVGIAWDSFGYDWPTNDPIISERDRKFPKLAEFSSPF